MTFIAKKQQQFRRRVATIFTLIILGAVASCALTPEMPISGTWVITQAVIPGVSAMDHTQAARWFGRSYEYYTDNAVLGEDTCTDPDYSFDSLSASEFKARFHVPLSQLGIEDSKVRTMNLACSSPGPMAGQQLILGADKIAYMLWDGVFFKLEEAGPAAISQP